MSVLAPEARTAVINCLRAGKGIRETARETGVNKTTVTNIDRDIGGAPRTTGYRPTQRTLTTEVASVVARRDAVVKALRAERETMLLRIREIDETLRQLGADCVVEDSR